MRLRRLLPIVVFCVLAAPGQAQPPTDATAFDWKDVAEQSIDLAAGDADPVHTRDDAMTLRGEEQSQCERFGRRSSASGAVDSSTTPIDQGAWRIGLSARARSAGGHYRDCVSCIAGRCVGFLPRDTEASAVSTAARQLIVDVDDGGVFNTYTLSVSPSAVDGLAVSVRDEAGGAIVLSDVMRGTARIAGAPGRRVVIEARLSASAIDKGGGGSATDQRSASVLVSLEKAPILASSMVARPFIRGGQPTVDYPEVVAIRIRDAYDAARKLHCTGVIVGPRTVLTAAHCISGYEAHIEDGRLDVAVSPKPSSNDEAALYIVTRGSFPQDSGMTFDKEKLAHDVGVLLVNRDLPNARARLQIDALDAPLIERETLSFVGYGYEMPRRDELKLSDTKRVGRVKVRVEDYRLVYNPTFRESSPCKGDSGGPAFFDGAGSASRVQVAIISGSDDETCLKSSYSTRVDRYMGWIAPRIR